MRKWIIAITLILGILHAPVARAQNYSIIQDAEIEEVLRSYLVPLFKTAGLNPDALRIFIVNDKSINAFATTNNSIFVFTGLILASRNYTEVEGVLAHETGHIAGGHILRMADNIKIAQRNMLISMILGGVAAVFAGRGDVGAAIAMAGSEAAAKSFLAYRRTEENAADQMAVKFLKEEDEPITGLLSVMKMLKSQDMTVDTSNSYESTHPLTSDRISFLENQADSYKQPALNPEKQRRFLAIKAKLFGFLADPDNVLKIAVGDDFPSKYARSIAYFRKHDIASSLKILDALIKENPDNPYLYELKGQILFENGKVKESLAPYEKAYELKPVALIRMSLAQSEIETNDKERLKKTIIDLRKIASRDPDNPALYRYLAICSGKTDNLGLASYYMAEYNFRTGKYKESLDQAKRAERLLNENSEVWIKLQDVKESAASIMDREKQKGR